MARFNPLYILSLPLLCSLTLPMAFFATLSTILAFTILIFRCIIIYTEIAFDLIPYYLSKSLNPPPPIAVPTFFDDNIPSSESSPTYNRSASSFAWPSDKVLSEQYTSSATGQGRCLRGKRKASLPVISLTRSSSSIHTYNTYKNAPFNLPLPSAPPAQRDFEGLGGWRLDAAPEDTVLFASINSRLELPGSISMDQNPSAIHNRRSSTSGSGTLISPTTKNPYASFYAAERQRHHSSVSFNLKTTRTGSFTCFGNTNSTPSHPHSALRNTLMEYNLGRRNSAIDILSPSSKPHTPSNKFFHNNRTSPIDIPSSPNTTRFRIPSPESTRESTRKSNLSRKRSSSSEYVLANDIPSNDGAGGAAILGDAGKVEVVSVRKRGSVGSDGSEETVVNRLSVSSGDSKGSGMTEEGLSMKVK